MKTIIHNFLSKIFILTICSSAFSCNKMIEVEAPINQSVNEKVFSSESSASGAINGLYTSFLEKFDSNTLLLPSISSDELKSNAASDFDFYTNSLKQENATISSQWYNFYVLLYQANSIIEGVELSNTLNSSFKSQLIGEAKFVRAFTYFELVNFFGDVPLILTTEVKFNSIAPRKSKELIYQQIIADLVDAQNLLTDNYPSADRARVNRSAVTALLARVYLYNNDYGNAEIQSTSIINNKNLYELNNLTDAFVKTSKETIFQIANVNGYTALGNSINLASSATKANFYYTDDFKNSIEINDNRKNIWMNSYSFGGISYLYPYKYKNTAKTINATSEYLIVLRLAEQYLIRSEAMAQQNKLDLANADLNMIRQRAGLENNKQSTKSQLLNAIEKEKRIEFSAEFGHRWFDLKRTGRIDAVMNIIKTNWKSTSQFYPIPLKEIQNNPNLNQNMGY